MKNLSAPLSLVAGAFAFAVVLATAFVWFPPNIISWDVFGYYLYLPMTFIYNDLRLQDVTVVQGIVEQYNVSSTFYQAFSLPNGNWVMKYSAGMAILYLPAFVFGHVMALMTEYPADGFSWPYQLGMFIEVMIIAGLSIWYLRKLLLRFFNDKMVAMLILLVIVGTNYLINTSYIGAGAGTHNYLFLIYCFIVILTMEYHEHFRQRDIILLGIACGMAILSRPSEIVCLLIPLFWGVTSQEGLREKVLLFKKHWKHLAVFSAVVVAIGSVQLFYWKYVTDSFFHYSYGGGAGSSFNFLQPHTLKVLFSYRKGWYLYTPMMLLATIGLIVALRKKLNGSWSFGLYFLFNLWIVSSWHCWWYAESFGQRSLVQSMPIMAVGLGYLFNSVNRDWLRKGLMSLGVLLLLLNLFQSYQFSYWIIDPSRQTGKYYWASFFDLYPSGKHERLKLVQRDGLGKANFGSESDYYHFEHATFDYEGGLLTERVQLDSTVVKDGKYSAFLTGEFSDQHLVKFNDLTTGHYVWFKVSVDVFPLKELQEHPFSLVMCTNYGDDSYKYQALDSEGLELKNGQWNKISMLYLSPEMRTNTDPIKAYLWNRGGNQMYMDNFKLEVYVPKFDPER